MGLVFGTAPDSWGVWFANHPSQPPWYRFLDEARAAGYTAIELGPYGYLPTDEARLRDELGRRNLGVVAGTLIDTLHVPAHRATLRARAEAIGELVSALGARFFVLIPGSYRPDGPYDLEPGEWKELVGTTEELGRLVRDQHGLQLTFHPHADTVVEYAAQLDRLLHDTDPTVVHLCLDTGHFEYRDGDSATLLRAYSERIPYLHLKSVAATVKARVHAEDLDFPTAVQLGAMCAPETGVVDFPALDRVIRDVGWDGLAVVEHDMFPLADPDLALPIAIREREYFERLGWTTRP